MKYQYIIIALIGILLSVSLDYSGSLHFLEMKALDSRYEFRADFFRQKEISPQIIVIGIDDASIAEIKQPFILWDTFFAEIIEKLGKYQTKVIGLDLIWTKQIDDFVKRSGQERNALRRALLIAKNKYHTQIVMGIGATTRKKSESQLIEVDSSLPMKQFGAIVGRKGFGVVNTIPDSDNYIRQIRLQYESATSEKNNLPSFSNLIAAKFLDSNTSTSKTTLLINYRLNNKFQIIPFNEVLKQARADNKNYFEQHFSNKIVLVGVTNVSGDILPTPMAQETPGILIHAHAIDMLINNNLLQFSNWWQQLTIIVVIAFLVVFYSSRSSIKTAVILTLFVFIFYSVINLLFFNENRLLPLIPPILLILWCFAVSFLYRFVSEEKSKRRLAKFFRSYVNEQVVKDILNSDKPLALEGKREKICILFSDIRNFTTYSENLPPEEVVKTLNEYFSAMTEVILENDGTVDKFIGDGLMAFFGAPLYTENPTLSAVKSAIQMRQRLEILNQNWSANGRAQLDNGIGIHTGYALVGNIGSDKKMDYTAIGDAVNTASRIEGLTKQLGTPVLLTKAAQQEVQEQILCEAKGDVKLKGRASVFVYELLQLKVTNDE